MATTENPIHLPSIDWPMANVERCQLFDEHAQAAFYVGILAIGSTILLRSEDQAAHRLRANVYIDEMHFLPPSARDENSEEWDSDDSRSIHFGVIENTDPARIVGVTRLILKRSTADKLPIESNYPDIFEDDPAPVYSAEVSRYIAAHPNNVIKQVIGLALIRAMAGWALENEIEQGYAVAEDRLIRSLNRVRLPYEPLTDTPRPLPTYNNTLNSAIGLNPLTIVSSIRPENANSSEVMRTFFADVRQNQGLGYFNRMLVGLDHGK